VPLPFMLERRTGVSEKMNVDEERALEGECFLGVVGTSQCHREMLLAPDECRVAQGEQRSEHV
jgi:hypothetical protein